MAYRTKYCRGGEYPPDNGGNYWSSWKVTWFCPVEGCMYLRRARIPNHGWGGEGPKCPHHRVELDHNGYRWSPLKKRKRT